MNIEGNWIVSIQNEKTGFLVNKSGTAQEVVNWLLEKAAENREIDDALEKTIETWRGDRQELYKVYRPARIEEDFRNYTSENCGDHVVRRGFAGAPGSGGASPYPELRQKFTVRLSSHSRMITDSRP